MNRSVWITLALSLLVAIGAGLWLFADKDGRQQRAVEAEQEQLDAIGRFRAGNIHVALALDPETPRTGNNRLLVELTGGDGKPITGAELRAVARMPAMGAMPEMRAPVEFEETGRGRYRGTFQLSMGGAWPLTLEILKEGVGDARLSFEMATGRRGLQLASGGEVMDGGGVDASDGEDKRALGEAAGPVITVDARRRQMIGVQIGSAELRPLTREIRAVGRIAYDETALSDITLRFDAWVGELRANFVGTRVQRGETLFSIYGPELLAAQQEYLSAYARQTRQAYGGDGLLHAARKRLQLWDIGDKQIRELEQRGEPLDYLPINAPRDGTVVAMHIVAGSAVKAGQTLIRVADLSRVWVDAQLYDAELPLVSEGMTATVSLPYLPGHQFEARVEYVYPFLQGNSRTARVRLSLDNPAGALKPDMYAEVRMQAKLGERLVVPEGAVLVAGDTRVVFVDQGRGRLQPVHIATGQRAEGYVEILDGLSAGDRVVTSGTFLIASESKLRGGMEQW